MAAEEFGVRVSAYGQLLEVRDDPSHTQAGEEPSYRCYLWFLERGRGERTLVLVDVSERRLKALARLDRRVLERVVLNLLGELPVSLLPGGGWAK